jgi:predicted secreted protein
MQDVLTALATAVEIGAAALFVVGLLSVASKPVSCQPEAEQAAPVVEPEGVAIPDEVVSPSPVEEPQTLHALDPFQLRKLCQASGIKWRNAHGKNKHLTKREMLALLEAVEQVA